VRTATASAMDRCVNKETMTVDADKLCVEFDDFEVALTEVHPKFGAPTADLELHFANGIVNYGGGFKDIQRNIELAVNQVRTSEKTSLLSLMLEGDNMTGKTALAAHLAVTSGFPFVRMITADALIGMGEQAKCNHIHKVFMDSYKSPLSVILLDDVERIIE
jgi:vesicle-fusing ATPase